MSVEWCNVLKANLEASIRAKEQLLTDSGQLDAFGRAAAALVACYRSGGRLFIAGNGGSAADAQHLATEFVSRLACDRAPLPAEALTTDSSLITAIGNDYGFEEVFARQIDGKVGTMDMFLGITTSGSSPNIVRALERCRARGVKSILFTGRDGGAAGRLADFVVIGTGGSTNTIQEVHIVLAHSLCESVERALFQ